LIAVTTFYYESDMSKTVTIELYYGIGEIIYGPQGVDLSNYSSIEKNVSRAGERTWEAITNWLVKAFSVDLEHQCMSVMALINRSAPLYWELVALKGTPRWRSFIRNSCRVGLPVILFIQVYQKGGSSSQVHKEAEDVNEGKVLKKGKMLKKVNNKRRKKGIMRVSRHLEVMLSLVLLMRRSKSKGDETISERVGS
jgi:hypothetical protein